MKKDTFRFTGEGKGRRGWADTPLAGTEIEIDMAETAEEAVAAGHFESLEAHNLAAYAQRRIRTGGPMSERASELLQANPEITIGELHNELVKVANGLVYGAKKSAEERSQKNRERAENAAFGAALREKAAADPKIAEYLRANGLL